MNFFHFSPRTVEVVDPFCLLALLRPFQLAQHDRYELSQTFSHFVHGKLIREI